MQTTIPTSLVRSAIRRLATSPLLRMHALMQAPHVSVQPRHALGCDISCASPTNHALRVLWHWAGARGEEGMKCSLASLLGTPFGLRHRRRGGCDGYCAPSEICRQTSRERLPRSQSVGLFYSAVTCLSCSWWCAEPTGVGASGPAGAPRVTPLSSYCARRRQARDDVGLG